MFKKVGIISVPCDFWELLLLLANPGRNLSVWCAWTVNWYLANTWADITHLAGIWDQSTPWCSAALWTAFNWPWDHILGPGTELCLLGSLDESSLGLQETWSVFWASFLAESRPRAPALTPAGFALPCGVSAVWMNPISMDWWVGISLVSSTEISGRFGWPSQAYKACAKPSKPHSLGSREALMRRRCSRPKAKPWVCGRGAAQGDGACCSLCSDPSCSCMVPSQDRDP